MYCINEGIFRQIGKQIKQKIPLGSANFQRDLILTIMRTNVDNFREGSNIPAGIFQGTEVFTSGNIIYAIHEGRSEEHTSELQSH